MAEAWQTWDRTGFDWNLFMGENHRQLMRITYIDQPSNCEDFLHTSLVYAEATTLAEGHLFSSRPSQISMPWIGYWMDMDGPG